MISGAGNPVGGSFTGPAEALEIIGDHAYAYSGANTTSGTGSANNTTCKFTSGNYYFVGTLAFYSDETGGATQYVDLTMNGQSVIKTSWDTAASSAMMSDTPVPIIIPPYTQVECLVGVSSGTDEWTTQLVGRIYRTRD